MAGVECCGVGFLIPNSCEILHAPFRITYSPPDISPEHTSDIRIYVHIYIYAWASRFVESYYNPTYYYMYGQSQSVGSEMPLPASAAGVG